DAVALDRLRELLEPGLVDVPAGLEFIRREAVDIRLDRRGRPRWRQIRNQRAEAFTECGTFFHGDHVERNARAKIAKSALALRCLRTWRSLGCQLTAAADRSMTSRASAR